MGTANADGGDTGKPRCGNVLPLWLFAKYLPRPNHQQVRPASSGFVCCLYSLGRLLVQKPRRRTVPHVKKQ